MKQFLSKYIRKYRAALMLVLVYSIHLFTVQSLLSNPYDFLSTSSFDDYKTKPDKCNDCLLLLAKKQTVKETVVPDSRPLIVANTITAPCSFLPQALLFTGHQQCLPADSYKLYRLIRVLLI